MYCWFLASSTCSRLQGYLEMKAWAVNACCLPELDDGVKLNLVLAQNASYRVVVNN